MAKQDEQEIFISLNSAGLDPFADPDLWSVLACVMRDDGSVCGDSAPQIVKLTKRDGNIVKAEILQAEDYADEYARWLRDEEAAVMEVSNPYSVRRI